MDAHHKMTFKRPDSSASATREGMTAFHVHALWHIPQAFTPLSMFAKENSSQCAESPSEHPCFSEASGIYRMKVLIFLSLGKAHGSVLLDKTTIKQTSDIFKNAQGMIHIWGPEQPSSQN